MINIIMGASGCGKDTLARRTLGNNPEISPIVSFTTRPRRDGEVNGREYNFVSTDEFVKLRDSGRLAEYRSYNTLVDGVADTWYYGGPLVDPKKQWMVILDIQGAESYIRRYGPENLAIYYIFVREDVRKERAINRGSFDDTEWARRAEDDRIKFSPEKINTLEGLLGKPIVIIDNNGKDYERIK